MTLSEFNTLLLATGFPVAYQAFPADCAPPMPFIVYQETGSDNFGADNTVYASAMRIQIDLLCSKKSRLTEATLENILTGANIFWERESGYDDTDDYFRTTYDVEIKEDD